MILVGPDTLDTAIDQMVELFRVDALDFFLQRGRLVRVLEQGVFSASVNHLRDRFSRLARFETEHPQTGARARTYPPFALIRGVIERAPTWARPIAESRPRAPEMPAPPDVGALLVAGLAAAMKELRVNEVRSSALVAALAIDPQRFRLLLECVRIGLPGVATDRLPNEKQLGRLIGQHRGLVRHGLRLGCRVLDGYTLWRVEPAPAVEPDAVLQ